MWYSDNTLLGISARLNTPVHSRTLTIDNTESSILIQGHGTLTEEDRELGLINQWGRDPITIHNMYPGI